MINVTLITNTDTAITVALGQVHGLDKRDTIGACLWQADDHYAVHTDDDVACQMLDTETVSFLGRVTTCKLSIADEQTGVIDIQSTTELDADCLVAVYGLSGLVAIAGGMYESDALDNAADSDLLTRWYIDDEDVEDDIHLTTLGGYGYMFDLNTYFHAGWHVR